MLTGEINITGDLGNKIKMYRSVFVYKTNKNYHVWNNLLKYSEIRTESCRKVEYNRAVYRSHSTIYYDCPNEQAFITSNCDGDAKNYTFAKFAKVPKDQCNKSKPSFTHY